MNKLTKIAKVFLHKNTMRIKGLSQWLCVCLLFQIFLGCHSLPEPDFTPDAPNVKILTYNVNWGFARPGKVLDFIDKSAADVVCLQETNLLWEQALLERFTERYPYYRFDNRPAAGGIAIMSRYPLKNQRLLPATAGWFPAQLAEVETPLGEIQFLNVHLHPPLSESGRPSLGALFTTPAIRLQEMQDFLQHANLTKPLIVTGDFNEGDNGSAVEWLLEQGFNDALPRYDGYSRTWQWKAYGITLRGRYDHIILSEHLACTGAQVTHVEASDHMPVEAVVIRPVEETR